MTESHYHKGVFGQSILNLGQSQKVVGALVWPNGSRGIKADCIKDIWRTAIASPSFASLFLTPSLCVYTCVIEFPREGSPWLRALSKYLSAEYQYSRCIIFSTFRFSVKFHISSPFAMRLDLGEDLLNLVSSKGAALWKVHLSHPPAIGREIECEKNAGYFTLSMYNYLNLALLLLLLS